MDPKRFCTGSVESERVLGKVFAFSLCKDESEKPNMRVLFATVVQFFGLCERAVASQTCKGMQKWIPQVHFTGVLHEDWLTDPKVVRLVPNRDVWQGLAVETEELSPPCIAPSLAKGVEVLHVYPAEFASNSWIFADSFVPFFPNMKRLTVYKRAASLVGLPPLKKLRTVGCLHNGFCVVAETLLLEDFSASEEIYSAMCDVGHLHFKGPVGVRGAFTIKLLPKGLKGVTFENLTAEDMSRFSVPFKELVNERCQEKLEFIKLTNVPLALVETVQAALDQANRSKPLRVMTENIQP
jgi:hypothetical protein